MPTYEYECRKCGHVFDVFQSMTDERISRCPKCRGKVVRLFGTGSGIIFKGSGFYETDYRRQSAGGGAEKAKSPSDTASADSTPPAPDAGKKTKKEPAAAKEE